MFMLNLFMEEMCIIYADGLKTDLIYSEFHICARITHLITENH